MILYAKSTIFQSYRGANTHSKGCFFTTTSHNSSLNHWLLVHITNAKAMVSGRRGINPVAIYMELSSIYE